MTRQYAGADTSSTYQDTTASFDGHGRLASTHKPEQRDSSDNLTYTTYSYNPDDSIHTVTDGRGAVTSYSYGYQDDSSSSEKRGLLTKTAYSVPTGSGITDPSDVTYSYDNLGNRTEMTDGLGIQTYSYDSLSEITSETRQFNETLSSAPQGSNSFTIGYGYTISGSLKTITEPWGVIVNYSTDKMGRLSSIAPSTSFGGVSTFLSNAQYRAWGATKHIEYSNGVIENTTFDNRLRPNAFQLGTTSMPIMDKSYEFYSDGNLKHVDDALNGDFDRLDTYDQAGRISTAKSGQEANAGTESNPLYHLPYRQNYSFDAFGKMASRYNMQWGNDANQSISYSYSNGRVTSSSNGITNWAGWQHDADGRVTASDIPEGPTNYKYDAAGQLDFKQDYPNATDKGAKDTRYLDGDGLELKHHSELCSIDEFEDPPPETCTWADAGTTFSIRSTVLGGEEIANAGEDGSVGGRFLYSGNRRIGELTRYYTFNPTQSHDAVQYYNMDPLGVSQRVTRNYPESLLGSSTVSPDYIDPRHAELNPSGGNVGIVTGYTPQWESPEGPPIPIESEAVFYMDGQMVPATVDGMPVSRQALEAMVDAGSVFPYSSGPGKFGNFRVKFNDGDRLYTRSFGDDLDAAAAFAERMGQITVFAHFIIDADSIDLSSFQTTPQYSSLHSAPKSPYPDATKTLRPRVDKALTDNCKSKLNQLLAKLGSDIKEFSQLEENVFSNKGINLDLTDQPIHFLYSKEGPWANAKTSRTVAPAGETVHRSNIILNREYYGGTWEVLTFIHELIHTTRRGDSHKDIANEIAALEGVSGQFKKYLKKANRPDDEASAFINSWLNSNCDINAGVKSWDNVLKLIGAN